MYLSEFMAIINCPACKARISDKSKTCSHCEFSLVKGETQNGESQEQIESKAKLARIKKRYSLQMQAMSGIILFLLGIVLWYFVGERTTNKPSNYLQLGLALGGAVWYLVTRVRLLVFKNQST